MTTAHLASIPDRENLLKIVLESICPYVDHTFVALNGYSHVPTWLDDFKTLTTRIYDNSRGDANKFAFINEVSGTVYICDDDLAYSPFYLSYMKQKLSQYNCPVSLHGKGYPRPAKGFKHFNRNYRCLNTVVGDHLVDVIGTGVLCFDTCMVNLSIDDFSHPNMADILFSRLCVRQGVKMMVVEHKAGIVKYLNPPTTIWSQTKNSGEHDRIIKEFLK
jgi:hypothetical protein